MEQIQLMGPQGPKPKQTSVSRMGVYVFLASAAIFFCIPLYVMLVTSLKGRWLCQQSHLSVALLL